MIRFDVTRSGDEFLIVEIADNGASEPVVRFRTEALARQWLARNAPYLWSERPISNFRAPPAVT
jgi:hypothetical protein